MKNFYSVDLPLNKLSIRDCIQDLFELEELNEENNNQYYDDKEDKYRSSLRKPTYFKVQHI